MRDAWTVGPVPQSFLNLPLTSRQGLDSFQRHHPSLAVAADTPSLRFVRLRDSSDRPRILSEEDVRTVVRSFPFPPGKPPRIPRALHESSLFTCSRRKQFDAPPPLGPRPPPLDMSQRDAFCWADKASRVGPPSRAAVSRQLDQTSNLKQGKRRKESVEVIVWPDGNLHSAPKVRRSSR